MASRVLIRFNKKHTGDRDAWRVIVDGTERHVRTFFIDVPCSSFVTWEEGEKKWNVTAVGELTIEDDTAYIR